MPTITLNPGQTKIIESKKRFIVACCGTGSGKSFLLPLWMADRISENPGGTFLCLAPTYKILMGAVIPHFINHYQGTNLEGIFNVSRNTYSLPDGGCIWFISTDSPQAAQGIVADAAVFDEAGLCPSADAWITIQQRLGFKQGRALIATTPYDPSGWLYDVVNKAQKGHADYEYVNMRSIDNEFYPKEEYERARAELSNETFQMRYNGIFGVLENAVCPDFGPDNITNVQCDPTQPILVGADFNVSPMCWTLSQQQGSNFVVYDEIHIPYNARTVDALDVLYEKAGNHKSQFYFFGDATSRSTHTSAALTDYQQIAEDIRFKRLIRHIRYPSINPAHIDRINPLNGLIKNANGERHFFVNERCTKLISDLKQARWKDGVRKIDKSNYDPHMLDALTYTIYMVAPSINKPREPLRVNV